MSLEQPIGRLHNLPVGRRFGQHADVSKGGHPQRGRGDLVQSDRQEKRSLMQSFFFAEIAGLFAACKACEVTKLSEIREFLTIGTQVVGAVAPAAADSSGDDACSLPNALKN